MSLFNNLPIMPKETKTPVATSVTSMTPYPPSTSVIPRTGTIWSSDDDKILLQARASGLNWQPIANQHFPSKSANACRKRHERLVEKQQAEDWDTQKLELLAQKYMELRRSIWEPLANELGERWTVVEAKCMEKGLKNLQGAARSAHRRAMTHGPSASFDEHANPTDRNSDSGIGFGSGSDAEMEVDDAPGQATKSYASSWHAHTDSQQSISHQEHNRSRSLPQPLGLPLYRPPPPPINTGQRPGFDAQMMTSPANYHGLPRRFSRVSPEASNGRGGISIESVLSPADP